MPPADQVVPNATKEPVQGVAPGNEAQNGWTPIAEGISNLLEPFIRRKAPDPVIECREGLPAISGHHENSSEVRVVTPVVGLEAHGSLAELNGSPEVMFQHRHAKTVVGHGRGELAI